MFLLVYSLVAMSKGKGTVAAVPFPDDTSSPNACCKNKLAHAVCFKHVFATAYCTLCAKNFNIAKN